MPPIRHLVLPLAGAALAASATLAQGAPSASCDKPVYLTFDTGHMELAQTVADVLKRQQVHATFFASNDRATAGGTSLSTEWERWWKARGAEGHEFASRTYEPVSWQADLPGLVPKFRVRHLSGGLEGRDFTWDAPKYCENIVSADKRLQDFTGKPSLPLFRVPGGAVSPRLVAAAKACGYAHVGGSPVRLVAAAQPGAKKGRQPAPLERLLKTFRPGDMLEVRLGGSAQEDAATRELLEPLVAGLKTQGYCFATLREHPAYRAWVAAPHPAPNP